MDPHPDSLEAASSHRSCWQHRPGGAAHPRTAEFTFNGSAPARGGSWAGRVPPPAGPKEQFVSILKPRYSQVEGEGKGQFYGAAGKYPLRANPSELEALGAERLRPGSQRCPFQNSNPSNCWRINPRSGKKDHFSGLLFAPFPGSKGRAAPGQESPQGSSPKSWGKEQLLRGVKRSGGCREKERKRFFPPLGFPPLTHVTFVLR